MVISGFAVSAWGDTQTADTRDLASPPPIFVPLEQTRTLPSMLERMAQYRVIVVGETHDRADHHENQLQIIRGLHERGVDLAVGLEFFQRPFQGALDDYVTGRLDEAQMLRATEYYLRWGFDYRLYRPILRYAREQGIPLVALNMEREITAAVSEQGLDGLSAAQQARLPESMTRGLPGYAERLRAVFAAHPPPQDRERDFARFLAVQLLWDETMAETAARYLQAHPGKRMVLLAGSGHVTATGIPLRLERRIGAGQVFSVLQTDGRLIASDEAHGLLLSRERRLPAAGRLGIVMQDAPSGGVVARDVQEGSAADRAGLKTGDVLVRLAGEPVRDTVDVRWLLLDRQPGEVVTVRLRRPALFGGHNEKTLQVTLGGAEHE